MSNELHYYSISSPPEIRKCRRDKLVYGFPIPYEWFDFQEKVIQETDGHTDEVDTAVLLDDLIRICHDVLPFAYKIKTTTVWTSKNYRGGRGILLVVGYPGGKPSADALKELTSALETCCILEDPGWFPLR